MFSPEEHPGIFTFMVGIIVIVLVAIGLSVMMEKRFAFSSGAVRLERETEVLAEEIHALRDRQDFVTGRLADLELPRARASKEFAKTKQTILEAGQRKQLLTTSRDELVKAVQSGEEEFSKYRADYRLTSRNKAVGEEIGTLTLRDGRKYLESAITKVTDVGLEIRHQHGFARIQAPDLGKEWQERFQWDDEERRSRLKEEELAHARMSAPKTPHENDPPKRVIPSKVRVSKVTVQPEQLAQDRENLENLRITYSGWKSKVNRLRSDHNEAVSNSARQRSVPGSLETWNSRASRLRVQLTKARLELSAARARLSAVSPRDPLLMTDQLEVE
ncbi:MAG: hypothetical protein V4640_08390 [Verrucomicrobiota bacterium]